MIEVPPISQDLIDTILASPIPYRDEEDEAQCKSLIEQLTDEEKEIAAQTSYAYWLASKSKSPPSIEIREKFALREARRHLVGTPFDEAAKNIKSMCAYRKEMHLDVLRTCFDKEYEYSPEEAEYAEKYRRFIVKDMEKQPIVVRGKDVNDHSIVLIFPRTSTETDEEAFIITQLYIVERAIACTEIMSRGKREKVVTVLDFCTFKASHSPPLKSVKAIVGILQSKFPERLKNQIIIDPPLWMRTLYGLVKPFLDPHTRKKFILVTGRKQKQSVLSDFVEPQQAMPFMLPDGKLTPELDLLAFVNDVPFHCLYDGEE